MLGKRENSQKTQDNCQCELKWFEKCVITMTNINVVVVVFVVVVIVIECFLNTIDFHDKS